MSGIADDRARGTSDGSGQASPTAEAELFRAEKKVVRKLDFVLMPILTVTLGLQYYDKAVLGSAAVFGILPDLGLIEVVNGVSITTKYSTATAAFYWGYIIAVLPFALLFARLPLPPACAVVVGIWGVVCILTVACTSYPGFIAQRFFLGLIESAVSPAFVTVTCLWYKPSEQATRMGVWYSATGMFSMISGVINFGIGHNDLQKQWQALYYFAGAVTIAWALPIYFFLPASPLRPGRFFSPTERDILLRRFQQNPFGKDQQPFSLPQFVEAVTDWKSWVYLLMATAIYICNGAVTAFGARIIQSFGYGSLETIALGIPGGFFTCITIYLFTYLSQRFKNSRTYMLPISCVPVIVGAITIWQAPWRPTAGPLIGYYLVATFGAPYVLLLSIAQANTAGSTKKATVSGLIFIGYNVGNIIAAYLVFSQEVTIKYRSTWIAVIVSMIAAGVMSLILRWAFIRENKRRDAMTPGRIIHAAADTGIIPIETDTRGAGEGEGESKEKERDLHGGETGGVMPPILPGLEDYRDRTDKGIAEFRYSL